MDPKLHHDKNKQDLKIFRTIPVNVKRRILTHVRKLRDPTKNHVILPYGLHLGEYAVFHTGQLK